jgi:hypothetical protein
LKCFLEFLNNNDGLIALISLIASLILVGVYIGILNITKRYTSATNKLAQSNAESAETTKKLSDTTNKNYEELKKQNDYFKESTENKYKLDRKSICKKLAYEITQNEVRLNDLQNFFKSKISKDFSKSKTHFEEKNYKDLLNVAIYKRFIESNTDFIDDEIFENIFTLYENIERIRRYSVGIVIANKGTIDVYLAAIKNMTEQSLEKTENLYDLFRKETGYDHKKSNFYKNQKEVIELLKDLEILQ